MSQADIIIVQPQASGVIITASSHSSIAGSKVGRKFRTPGRVAQPGCRSGARKKTRNAFMHFLEEYRRKRPDDCRPATALARDAGVVWSVMPPTQKQVYIAAARQVDYTYKSRYRRLNRVMTHLREALKSDERVNLVQLMHAVKQMQLWKRNLLRELLADDSDYD